MEQFPATNPNPVLSVEKDGTVLYSNEAGEPLLHEWGMRVGEKLPSFIGEFVQRVISQNSPEKTEAKVGNKVYLIILHPSPEEKCVGLYGFDISDQKELERKLQEAYENLQVQSEELQVQSEELQAQSEELQVQYEELQIQSEEIHKAYESLHESENKFRTLTENSPDLITRFDRQSRHTFANSAAVELYCCSQEEVIGKTYTELGMDHGLIKLLEGHFENVFITRKSEAIEFQFASPQGKEYYFNTRIVPEFVNDDVTSVLAISRDITERKKSEETNQILANIVESSNDAIGTISLDGVITSWNKGAEQVYGYSVEEILGKPISILAPPHLKEETRNLSEKIKQGKKVRQYETLRSRKDKKIIYVSISLSPVFDAHGKLTFVSFISRDITERKEIEEKLRESEEKYRNIVETANEGIFTMDGEFKVTYANRRTAELMGYSQEEVIGKSIMDFIPEESKPLAERNLENRRRGISESYELKLVRKDGSLFWALVNGRPVINKDDDFTGSLCMYTDITKRKEAEETLAHIESARKKEIHHRIKNNLQVISSLLDLQAEKFNGKKGIEDSEVLEAFRESQDRVISMALIHEELHKGGEIDTLNFSQYIKELADNLFLTYRLGNDYTSLDMDIEEDIFFDMDTAVPLGIIINELVSNSLKYAFPDTDKGEIRIKLRREGSGERKSEDCNMSLTLSVSDNGVGIPDNLDIEDIDSLGLQLVVSLIDQLDGKLELKRGNGTEFNIKFTVTEDDDQASGESQLQLFDNE